MKDFIINYIFPIIDLTIFIYVSIIVLVYIFLGVVSFYAIRRYKYKNKNVDYFPQLFSESLSPSISIISPCFNEAKTIVEFTHSLLSLRYSNYEVVIVNDGSTDNSLEKLCENYKLQKVEYVNSDRLPHKPIQGVYKSTEDSYYNLIVVDKVNGGKADTLNAGLSISSKYYVVCVDSDSILAVDSLLKLTKPILENEQQMVISVGAAVHVANGCTFDNGVLIDHRIPKKNLIRSQVVEYLRAFLIGRMAFSQINGLMLISGALGIFNKQLLFEIGGYDSTSIGEDMELTVRLRRYMYDHKIKHSVKYIPEPLIWTEVPSTKKVLSKQRSRWTRGLIDTLRKHKSLFFNPKYGRLGMISYPYYVFFEWLAPFVELFGFLYVILLIGLGMINWPIYLFLFIFIYLFGVSLSFLAVFYGHTTYPTYKRRRELIFLFTAALSEIFFFHPFLILSAMKGNWMYFRGKKEWGDMTRSGFKKEKE